jgi:hypothetical protein
MAARRRRAREDRSAGEHRGAHPGASEEPAGLSEPSPRGGVGVHEQQVRGAVRAALGVGIEHRGGGDAEDAKHGQRPHCDDGQGRPVERSLVRPDQDHVRDQGRPRRIEDETGRERAAGGGAVPLADEPGDGERAEPDGVS